MIDSDNYIRYFLKIQGFRRTFSRTSFSAFPVLVDPLMNRRALITLFMSNSFVYLLRSKTILGLLLYLRSPTCVPEDETLKREIISLRKTLILLKLDAPILPDASITKVMSTVLVHVFPKMQNRTAM